MKRTKNTPKDIYGWLDRVFRHLRFGGNEAALRQELTDHFEDRLNFLLEQGGFQPALGRTGSKGKAPY